jgi:uncharacterized surface protein with fasciclin (FAS1) repeats
MGKKSTIAIVAILIIIGGVSAYFLLNGGKEEASQPTQQQSAAPQSSGTKDITVVIADTNSLSTLSSALQTAALDQTLQEVGPYTVLAPTDKAFENLPEGTLASLLKPDSAKQLTSILTYHVIPGKLLISQLTNGQKLKTVNGQEVIVEISEGATIFIDAKGAKAVVEKANIQATNGVVHTVNAVLLPQ